MAPGERSEFGTPVFETEVLPKLMYCIEESTCDIAWTLRRSRQWLGVPMVTRHLENCAPLVTPLPVLLVTTYGNYLSATSFKNWLLN